MNEHELALLWEAVELIEGVRTNRKGRADLRDASRILMSLMKSPDAHTGRGGGR